MLADSDRKYPRSFNRSLSRRGNCIDLLNTRITHVNRKDFTPRFRDLNFGKPGFSPLFIRLKKC